MISSVIQYDSLLVVRDETGQQIGTISLGGGQFIGYSNTFILLRYGNMYATVDENQYPMGNTILPGDFVITGITNNGFLARTGQLLQMYDPYCNHVGVQVV
jgi:hypothetical protein